MNVKFIGKKFIGYNTYSLSFQSKKRVQYLPGQYVYVTLPDIATNEGRGPTRQFTLSSSPTETDLVITTQKNDNSPFKKKFLDLIPDTNIEIDGPHGIFYFDNNTTGNHVFIAGGLGVTAYRSMLKFAEDNALLINVSLYYYVNDFKNAVFLDEFKNWVKKDLLNLNIIETKGSGAKKINVKHPKNNHFWITGSPKFVTFIENMLLKQKVNRDNIHFEKFTGLV